MFIMGLLQVVSHVCEQKRWSRKGQAHELLQEEMQLTMQSVHKYCQDLQDQGIICEICQKEVVGGIEAKMRIC